MTIAERLRREGMKEGIIEGEQKAVKKVAQKMLLLVKSEEDIIEFTNLSEEELTQIKQSLEN